MPWNETQRRTLVRPFDPDADAILAALAAHVEGGKGPDDPFLQTGDVGAHVRSSPFQVQHRIGDPLARTVIGELAAAAGLKHREAGVEQIAGPAAGAGGVERRVLQQPHQFARFVGRDVGHARFHLSHGIGVGHWFGRNPPFHIAAARRAREGRQIKALAVINHWLTITWSGEILSNLVSVWRFRSDHPR
jgi:hypothetical protein